jgi:hypothetical protein
MSSSTIFGPEPELVNQLWDFKIKVRECNPRFRRLQRDEVRAAIKFKNPPRPPIATAMNMEHGLVAQLGDFAARIKSEYPDDISNYNAHVDYWYGTPEDPNYRWAFGNKHKPHGVGIDNCPVLADWNDLDQFIEEMPSPYAKKPINELRDLIARSKSEDYVLVSVGHYFNQKFQCIRGTQNLLMDMYDNPKELHRLLRAVLEYYRILIPRLAEAGANGIHGGEDLGTQQSLFMSPEKFREFYKPYYIELAGILKSCGLDFWMHTCGNVTEIFPDLIECGIDIIHPIQVGTMDASYIVKTFKGQIAFHVGMDVQTLIPSGTVEEVISGIRERAELFYDQSGGVVYGAGNVLMANTPAENIEAYIKTLFEFCMKKHR